MFRRGVFLTAAWKQLALLNFSIDPKLLESHVPRGTELDFHGGQTYVSIVGFLFQRTAICGVPAFGHRDFTEINLRFYVRRQVEGQWRRGVVFIQEIVHRRAVTFVARALYGENYVTRRMDHYAELIPELGWPRVVEYRWQQAGIWNRVGLRCADREPVFPRPGSLEEFIIEHYWGYALAGKDRAREYQVEHPRWKILPPEQVIWDCDPSSTYGNKFGPALKSPQSAFLALGSEISVRWPSKF